MKVKNVLLWFLGLAVFCGVFYGFGFLLRATGTTWLGDGPINPQEIPPFAWSVLGVAVYVSVHLATWISACLDEIYEREAEERRFVRKLMAEEERKKEDSDGSDSVH